MRTTLVMALALTGLECGEREKEGGGALTTVPTSTCASGKQWTSGNQGSALMRPGADCIGCHQREGPKYNVAGTVYAGAHEAEDCAGVQGATVEITDAQNRVISLTTNEAGNYFLDTHQAAPATPYQVKVIVNGAARIMAGAPTSGACNTCHSANGSNAAPGRVQAP